MNETMAATHIDLGHRPKPQCLGASVFDVDASIVDPETLAELRRGEAGESIVAGLRPPPEARRDGQGADRAARRPPRSRHLAAGRRLGARPHGGLQDPGIVEFFGALPGSGTGKVAWRELQKTEHRRRPVAV